MTPWQRFVKRGFDVAASALGLVLTGPIILCAAAVAWHDTRLSGFFRQTRVGLNGRPFWLIKIRTMRHIPEFVTTVTTLDDPRITRCGRFFRRTKIDELPQLWNVLRGDMSFVGPRPDVPAVIEALAPVDRIILSVRPGITGPASLKYRDEETLLATQPDPEQFNSDVIFPDKVAINRQYVTHYSFWNDLACIWQTVVGGANPAQLPAAPAGRRRPARRRAG